MREVLNFRLRNTFVIRWTESQYPYFWSLSRINSNNFLSGKAKPSGGADGVPDQTQAKYNKPMSNNMVQKTVHTNQQFKATNAPINMKKNLEQSRPLSVLLVSLEPVIHTKNLNFCFQFQAVEKYNYLNYMTKTQNNSTTPQ